MLSFVANSWVQWRTLQLCACCNVNPACHHVLSLGWRKGVFTLRDEPGKPLSFMDDRVQHQWRIQSESGGGGHLLMSKGGSGGQATPSRRGFGSLPRELFKKIASPRYTGGILALSFFPGEDACKSRVNSACHVKRLKLVGIRLWTLEIVTFLTWERISVFAWAPESFKIN